MGCNRQTLWGRRIYANTKLLPNETLRKERLCRKHLIFEFYDSAEAFV